MGGHNATSIQDINIEFQIQGNNIAVKQYKLLMVSSASSLRLRNEMCVPLLLRLLGMDPRGLTHLKEKLGL